MLSDNDVSDIAKSSIRQKSTAKIVLPIGYQI